MMSDIFYRIVAMNSLEENKAVSKTINGKPVAIALFDGKVTAFLDICPHAGAHLSGGRIRRGRIFCPLHGAPFNLETGVCMSPQHYPALNMLPVRVVDGWIEVSVESH
jgi:3-phenylpropionate/trans-cinnamate dioxygenase ferredoxin subunit